MDFTSAEYILRIILCCIYRISNILAVYSQMVVLILYLFKGKKELYFCKGYYWNCIYAKGEIKAVCIY